jgi:hypothetical protein
MEKRTITMVFLMLITALFVQCGTKNGSEPEQTASITTSSNQDTVIEKKKEVLTKVLTKEKGEHADDIVVLTPEFIKAIQGYDEIGVFSEGLAAVKKDGKWGYINTKGEVAIPITIDTQYSVGRFSEGVAYVVDEDRSYGFRLIDTNGKTVFTSEEGEGTAIDCDHIESAQLPYYVNGKMYIFSSRSGYYIVFDNCGNKVDSIEREEGDKWIQKELGKNNYTAKYEKGKGENWYITVKDSKGKVVIPAKYDYVQESYYYSDGYINCQNGVFLVGFIDENEDAENPTYWGYVDLKGNDTFSKDIKKQYGRH